MPRPRGFSRGAQRVRRRTGWELGPGGTSRTAISADAIQIMGSGVTLLLDGTTLVRLRGVLEAFLSTAGSIADGFACAVGVGIINEDAFAIGATTIMDPLGDAEWDGWLYHRFFNLHAITATLADGVNANSAYVQIEVDSKAMRKLTDGDVVFAALETVEDGVATGEVFFDSRMLLKLP